MNRLKLPSLWQIAVAVLPKIIHVLLLLGSILPITAQVPDAFDPNVNNPSGNDAIFTATFDREGRVLIGGSFTNISAQPRYYSGRINGDGVLDLSFNPAPNGQVLSTAEQPDGKTLIAGFFSTYGGVPHSKIVRLHRDGSLDLNFNASVNNSLYAIALQEDGKILIGGSFTVLNGQNRTNIGRLNSDGSVDLSFNAVLGVGPGIPIVSFNIQPDGKILIAGVFPSVGGLSQSNFARLNIDGTADTNFNARFNQKINTVVVKPDGKILVGGLFDHIGGLQWTNLARLNTDGTVDTNFNSFPNGEVAAMSLQADGRIIVTGNFTTMNGQPCTRLGRLNEDGTVDSTFNSSVSAMPRVLGLQKDGRIVVGGNFVTLGGAPRNRIGRLLNTDSATESVVVDDSMITWLRGGTGPEVVSTEFTASLHGTNWVPAGMGQRVAGGWQVAGAGFTTMPYVKARGVVTSKASTWNIETVVGPLKVIASPTSCTNRAGTMATFTGEAIGGTPIDYRWFKAGVPLANGGNIYGATTPVLVLTNVLASSDAGDYFLVASNASGCVTSLVATLSILDPVIVVQPLNTTNLGQTATFSIQALGSPSLSYQWRKDGIPLVGKTTTTLSLTNIQNADIASYDAVVSNSYGSVTSAIATLAFVPTPDSLSAAVSGVVYTTALQRDGKILVGGSFGSVGGQSRGYIARVNADGTIDATFNPGADYIVFSLIVQPDDKILVAGWFTSIGGQSRVYLARLNANGTVDTNFNANVTGGVTTPGIYSMALRPNGKILIAGDFRGVGGQNRTNIAQLNADGTVDLSYKPPANDIVYPLIVQPDGKVVVGGNFTNLCGVSRQHIGRLNLDGTIDTQFNPGTDNLPLCMALQPDEKILVGGSFTSMGGLARTNIARLNQDGTIDTNFTVRASSLVRSMALQADGKIILGGNFVTLGSQTNRFIGRLLSDGTPDPTFALTTIGTAIYSVAIQPDGNILVGGDFQTGGRNYLARLTATGPISELFTRDGVTTRWVRGGTAPQSSLVSFEFATGPNWPTVSTVIGQWTNGGWELEGAPTNAALRIRSFSLGGRYGCSRSMSEFASGPLEIWQQPLGCTNAFGTTASFSVTAVGTGPLSYQWYKETSLVTNSTSITGANSSSLVLSNLFGGSAGDYLVVISNATESVTSAVARLTLLDPILTLQPISRTNNAGSNQTFTVAATGTAPLSYKWFKDGIELVNGGNIVGAQTATVTVTNLLHADMGSYSAIVSNISGSVTSTIATLKVIDPFISTQPANKTINGGSNAVLNVVAAGSALNYQWRKDAVDIATGKGASLTVTNAQWLDRGNYTVVVNNSFGSVTSSIAILNVVFPYPAAFTTDDGNLGFSSNRFGFNMRGNSGQMIVIDGSTNLSNWTPLRTNTFGFGSFYFSDPESTNGTGRFYRARLP